MLASTALGSSAVGTTIERSNLRLLWLAPFALAAQLCAIYFAGGTVVRLVLPCSLLLLIPLLAANWSYIGSRLLLAGLLMNLVAMAANGGLMPVEAGAIDAVGRQESLNFVAGEHVPGSKNVLLKREDVNLRGLSDVILLPVPPPLKRALSIGDIFIISGMVTGGFELQRRLVNRATARTLRVNPSDVARFQSP